MTQNKENIRYFDKSSVLFDNLINQLQFCGQAELIRLIAIIFCRRASKIDCEYDLLRVRLTGDYPVEGFML